MSVQQGNGFGEQGVVFVVGHQRCSQRAIERYVCPEPVCVFFFVCFFNGARLPNGVWGGTKKTKVLRIEAMV